MDGKVKAMRGSPLFQGCTVGVLQQLARLLDGVSVPAGTRIELTGRRELHVLLGGTAMGVEEGGPVRMLNAGAVWGGTTASHRSMVALTELTLLVSGLRTRRRVAHLCPALAVAESLLAPTPWRRPPVDPTVPTTVMAHG